MYYITVRAPQRYHQMTLEELIYGYKGPPTVSGDDTCTHTYEVESVSEHFTDGLFTDWLIDLLSKFNRETQPLRQGDRHAHYTHFAIPKQNGKLRWIDAPDQELMEALRTLKNLFENQFQYNRSGRFQSAFWHTSAYAYIKKRSHKASLKPHQTNRSKWFAKFDTSNFFGTTTLDFTMHMLSMVFPFCEICKSERGFAELKNAVELGFLDGVLPQGTPLSPTLTNIIMIPIDFRLSNTLRDFNNQHYIYTRYADDMLVTSKYTFRYREIERLIEDVFAEFAAPYKLNKEKTRYGSSSGANWNLGLMLNRDNEITVGHKKKKQLQAMLSAYAMDRLHGIRWSYEDLAHMDGVKAYYRSIEGETIDRILAYLNKKFGFDLEKAIRADLKSI